MTAGLRLAVGAPVWLPSAAQAARDAVREATFLPRPYGPLSWPPPRWLAAGHDTDGPGVARTAHVVGFMLGFLYAWLRLRTAAASDEGISP